MARLQHRQVQALEEEEARAAAVVHGSGGAMVAVAVVTSCA